MKKRSLLIGLSLATGVVSSLLLRKEKQKMKTAEISLGIGVLLQRQKKMSF